MIGLQALVVVGPLLSLLLFPIWISLQIVLHHLSVGVDDFTPQLRIAAGVSTKTSSTTALGKAEEEIQWRGSKAGAVPAQLGGRRRRRRWHR